MNELCCYFYASNPVLTVDVCNSLPASLDAPEDRVNSHGAENQYALRGMAQANGGMEEVELGGLHGGGVAQGEFVVGRPSLGCQESESSWENYILLAVLLLLSSPSVCEASALDRTTASFRLLQPSSQKLWRRHGITDFL